MLRVTMVSAGILAAVCGGASAASLDFATYANSGEHGVASGATIDFGGLGVRFNANNGYHPYFDASSGNETGAGLGVCKILNLDAQCSPNNDDNIQQDEWVKLTFDRAVNVSDMLFSAEGHVALPGDVTLKFGYNGGALQSFSASALGGLNLSSVNSLTFGWDDSGQPGPNPDQFYVRSMTVSQVPLPASALLLLAGLGGLAVFGGRRRAV